MKINKNAADASYENCTKQYYVYCTRTTFFL